MAKDKKEKTAEGEETPSKRSKKTLIIPLVVLIVGLGAGGYFMFGKKDPAEAEAKPEVELGSVVRLDPITMNLSDGRVLKVGMALQMVKEPKGEHLAAAVAGGGEGKKADSKSPLGGEEAKAIHTAIQVLGDSTMAQLSAQGGRAEAQKRLAEKVKETYHGDVVDVYFTDFVMS